MSLFSRKGSHWKGPIQQNAPDYLQTVGGTNDFRLFTAIRANASVEGTLKVAGAVTLSGVVGVGQAGGQVLKFASGTYIGTGAATAAITSTGLTSITEVFMSRKIANVSGTATTVAGRIITGPAKAAGTPGSFYPFAYRSTATNKNVTLGIGLGATFGWFAIGT